MLRSCPVCESGEVTPTISRSAIPILQNRVYDTRDEALAASRGPFTLCTCSRCGFSYNGAFDEALIVYDENYNNDVPSPTFERYTEDLARDLIKKFDLATGTVYDIGCGKGTFLRMLCRLAPGITGIGIDPSCDPVDEGNFRLVRDVFRPGSFGGDTRLVVLRHVLEHITEPVSFLRDLGEAAPNVPLYVEVPEVDWIFENNTFWDFCYEHCNYFSATSLKNATNLSGYTDIEQSPAFGGQYQWAVGVARGEREPISSDGAAAVSKAKTYAHAEKASIERVRHALEESSGAAIWGMATKGVILSCIVNGAAAGIDINEKKQGKFAPLSGLKISPPERLQDNDIDTVFIMNGNYQAEIRDKISAIGVDARVVVM